MTRQDWFLFGLGPLAILLIWALLPSGRSEAWRADDGASADAVAELVGYAFEAPEINRPLLLGRSQDADIRLHSAPVAPRAAWLTPPGSRNDAWVLVPVTVGVTLRRLEREESSELAGVVKGQETSVRPWQTPSRLKSRLLPFGPPEAEPIVLSGGDARATVTPVKLQAVQWPGWAAGAREPEVAWLDPVGRPTQSSERAGLDLLVCVEGAVWSRPRQEPAASEATCGGDLAGWTRVGHCWPRPTTWLWPRERTTACVEMGASSWGARVTADGIDRFILPWSEDRVGTRDTIWLRMSGRKPSSIRVGVASADADDGLSLLENLTLRSAGPMAGNGKPAREIGPLEVRDGDLLAVGRTRFLVRTDRPPTPSRQRRLELYHVRDPEAPGYFRASASHDAYHPNRRALWNVPACHPNRDPTEESTSPIHPDAAKETVTQPDRQETLTLAIEPAKTDVGTVLHSAELTERDRARQDQIAAAIRDHGVPHELPTVAREVSFKTKAEISLKSETADPRSLLSLCTMRGEDRELRLQLVADSTTGIRLNKNAESAEQLLNADRSIHLGTFSWPFGWALGDPQELLVDVGGNLLRVAPTAAPRITRRTRTGLAAFLIFVLTWQAWWLTRSRRQHRRTWRRGSMTRAASWPDVLAAPTLQQLTGIAIVSLLFLGASFHLLLALHPELVGKPDYLQAFLQGIVTVCVALTAAAGFSSPALLSSTGRSTLGARGANAAFAVGLTLLAAAGWWAWDAALDADSLWLSQWRDHASATAKASPERAGRLLLFGSGVTFGVAAMLALVDRLLKVRLAEGLARGAIRRPFVGFLMLAVAGLLLGLLQRSALAFELALAMGLAWYAAVYWAYVRQGRSMREDRWRRQAAALSMASGLLMLIFLAIFFSVGADLPDAISWASVVLGLAVLGLALRIARAERSTSLLRMVALWIPASILGMAFASFVLTDMGSVAAWLPALITGFFLWLVRPEEIENRREEPRKALSHLLLAVGTGLVLLGVLDVFKRIVQGLDWQVLERPQQRLALAEDISYITAGEWITQVRWLASQQDDTLHWVPNVNSDIAIFGLAANLGPGWAIAASLVLLMIAGCAALAADQALREAQTATLEDGGDRLRPVLYRALGLILGMLCVLLISQWLVHLATGVVLHLPITGLVFPWISHGNTTHLLYTAALLLPMAALVALRRSRRGEVR